MRRLFDLDLKDYGPDLPVFSRPSSRALIIRGGRIAMMHSTRDSYYKFPGGGIEPGETPEGAVIRETAEEAGLRIIPASLVLYGCVHRRQRLEDRVFDQMNYYWLCEAEEQTVLPAQDPYEQEEGFELHFVRAEDAILENRTADHGEQVPLMIERECMILELLQKEGYLPYKNPECSGS